jgi:O-Antigen ligase
MWDAVSAACVLIGALFVFSRFRELTDLPTRVLLVVIWLRFTMQAFPAYSVDMRVGGQSLNALATLASVAAMLVAADNRLLRLRRLAPIYLVCGAIVLSGVVNAIAMGTIDNAMRWLFMLGIVVLSLRAFLVHGRDRVLRALLTTIIAPLLQLVASLALGVSKAVELDGSVSYIGGFGHEVVFSTILLVFGILVAFVEWRSRSTQLALVALVLLGIMLTDYRTSLISALPLMTTVAVVATLSVLKPRMRVAMSVVAIATIVTSIPIILNSLPERYADIMQVGENLQVLTKKPYELTEEERRLFSGRIDLWSLYIYSYQNGSELHKIFGFGPDAHEGVIRHQAHNSFISFLYEQGFIGLIVLIFHFLFFMTMVNRGEGVEHVAKLLAATGGFILFNLAGNGLWSIESFIQYGLLIAITLEPTLRKAVERDSLARPDPSLLPSMSRSPAVGV